MKRSDASEDVSRRSAEPLAMAVSTVPIKPKMTES